MGRFSSKLTALSLNVLTGACAAMGACAASCATPPAPPSNATSATPTGMVSIPAGTFEMGSPAGTGERNEGPARSVKVAAFSIDATEVTVSAYADCVHAGACTPALDRSTTPEAPGGVFTEPCNAGRADRRNHPINCVDWQQASAYCSSVGKRLPTEEEWEYAARGQDKRTYPWGNEDDTQGTDRRLCCGAVPGPSLGTCPVGSFPRGASPFGVEDMAGNVGEWTSSNYSETYDQPASETLRVVRGGEWDTCTPSVHRSASRAGVAPARRDSMTGFRCAR